jgi:hypothetical protein
MQRSVARSSALLRNLKTTHENRAKLQQLSQGHCTAYDAVQGMKLTALQQIQPTRKNQYAAKKGVKKNALPPILRGVSFV